LLCITGSRAGWVDQVEIWEQIVDTSMYAPRMVFGQVLPRPVVDGVTDMVEALGVEALKD